MAKKLFDGGSGVAVKKAVDLTVGGTLAGEKFDILIGGVLVATHTDATGTIADTVAALFAAFNANTHPYTGSITATDSSPSVRLTSDAEGLDFEVTINTPGGSATFTQSVAVPNSGPNDLSTADNWIDVDSGQRGNLPDNGDEVIIDLNASPNACWGLEAFSAKDFAKLTIRHGNARVGLDGRAFATTADGIGTDPAVPEYRPRYVKCGAQQVVVGDIESPGIELISGAGRVMLDLGTVQSVVDVIRTASQGVDTGRPAVRLLANNAATLIYVREGADGGVGIAVDKDGEVSTTGKITNSGKAYTGDGATFAAFEQHGTESEAIIRSAATLADLTAFEGLVTTEGDYEITNLVNNAATLVANHVNESGNAVESALLYGGSTDTTQQQRSRTWNNVTVRGSAILARDSDALVINNLDERFSRTAPPPSFGTS